MFVWVVVPEERVHPLGSVNVFMAICPLDISCVQAEIGKVRTVSESIRNHLLGIIKFTEN